MMGKDINSEALVSQNNSELLLLPLIGIGLFLVCYIVAASNYPGGSWMFPDADGFSFQHNYLCDLLDEYAINGELNAARFYARTSLGSLCISLLLIWFYLPKLFHPKSVNQAIMRITGIVSLATIMLLNPNTHDGTVRVAGIFGVLALISCFIELFKARYYCLFGLGILCLVVFLFNYYSYETGSFIEFLPLIQKITFILFLTWFVFLNVTIYLKRKNN